MDRQWVNSSVIWNMGYDPILHQLEIEFRETHDMYLYFDVPQEEYAAFCAAESKGTYLNQVFKTKNYRNQRIR